MEREKGFYWVKCKIHPEPDFEIGYFDGSGWQFVKSWNGDDIDSWICDDDLDKIDEVRIVREQNVSKNESNCNLLQVSECVSMCTNIICTKDVCNSIMNDDIKCPLLVRRVSVCGICGKPIFESSDLCFEHSVCNVPKPEQTDC